MASWTWRTVAIMWIAWTIVLYAGVRYGPFASLNLSLPLPTRITIGSIDLGQRAAVAITIAVAVLLLYAPPLLLTIAWRIARWRRA